MTALSGREVGDDQIRWLMDSSRGRVESAALASMGRWSVTLVGPPVNRPDGRARLRGM